MVYKEINIRTLVIEGFKIYVKNLDLFIVHDKKIFFKIVNSFIKNNKVKTVKGIKEGELILMGEEKDKSVEKHFTQLFWNGNNSFKTFDINIECDNK